jgi:hypothetical protein
MFGFARRPFVAWSNLWFVQVVVDVFVQPQVQVAVHVVVEDQAVVIVVIVEHLGRRRWRDRSSRLADLPRLLRLAWVVGLTRVASFARVADFS